MKINQYSVYLPALIFTLFFFSGCDSKPVDNHALNENSRQVSHKENTHEKDDHDKHNKPVKKILVHEHHRTKHIHIPEKINEIYLTASKFENQGIKIDPLPFRSLSGVVKVNGRLTLFPHHRATVTAILGANVTAIKVIEGEKVKKGQILAYLSHPNLTNLQTAYIRTYNQLQFLEKEFEREKRLYEAGVSSGKTYQQTQANYLAMKGEVKGYETQLKQLNINVKNIRAGNILQNIPVVTPIDGNIEKVFVQIGQFVDPNTTLFMVINLDHIHADFMVFEKNVRQVQEGQKVTFKVESVPETTLSAKIISVGKNFEQTPRAVHVHAEIEQKGFHLIPGMYVSGHIHTENIKVKALPEDAIVMDEGRSYIFLAEDRHGDQKKEWIFSPLEVKTGISDQGWVEITLLEPLPKNAKVVWNKAYYLMAEMKKNETLHEH